MHSDNLIGNILGGRYDVIEKIGTGGMGSVYKAKDTLLNRFVAIKVLRDALEGEKNIVSNFIKEAQSAASLTHNNIVSVFDVGEDDGLNFMVMELVDGRTLKDYIKEKGALPWQEACDYCIQVGQGLAEAHSKNIIHRDIKPQNIMMTKDKTLKVTDFGIAKALSSDTTIVGGTALGSVHYISPEQARGGFMDARSDIYSLGIVLYEMLTGKVPFDGANAVSVALMHLEKEPVNVKCVNMDIPQDLAYVTMKAITKEQAKRYQTVTQLLEDIHAVLAEEPLPSAEKSGRVFSVKTDDDDVKQYHMSGSQDVSSYDDFDNDFDDDFEDDFDELDDDLYDAPEEESDEFEEEDIPKKNKLRDKTDDYDIGIDTEGLAAQKEKTPAQRRADKNATLAALGTVLAMLVAAFVIYIVMNTADMAKVPNVLNMTSDEANAAIVSSGLRVSSEEYAVSDDVEMGRVISQEVEAGTKLEKGSAIKITVSVGRTDGNIAVPEVTGQEFDKAVLEIMDEGLNYTIVEDYSDEVGLNCVMRQSPSAGTMLGRGDVVTIYLNRGAKSEAPTEAPRAAKVIVPSLNGETRESAEAVLKQAGLSLGSVTYQYAEAEANFIVTQSPAANKEADSGSVVNVVISKGRPGSDDEESDDRTGSENADVITKEDIDKSNTGGKNTFTVRIPDGIQGDQVNVRIVVDGTEQYNSMHSTSEGTVSVELKGKGTVSVQAYIDGSKVDNKEVELY